MTRKQSDQQEKKAKKRVPKAIREQTWLKSFGKVYEHSCYIKWCDNKITVFDFHVGHDKPESKGGKLRVDNLKPICARCNLSMSNNYSIQEWIKLNEPPPKTSCCCFRFWK